MKSATLHLFVACAGGVEPLLAEEVAAIAPKCRIEAQRGGVAVRGDAETVMRLNLYSRLGQRVLVELAYGPYRHEDDLYGLARKVDWRDWITPEQTLKVDVTAQRSPLHSLNFAALRVKDAICDQLREHLGARPSVDTRAPDLPVVLHLGPEIATLYVDTSGEPLFKRGWREDKGDAPLKETLAAAMLAAAGWDGSAQSGALLDPCCGSGTIAIEAARIACGIAAGGQCRFAFERQRPFQPLRTRWAELKKEAKAAEHAPAVPIYASDVAFRMVDFSRRNAERAGVAQHIQFNGGDALERPAPQLPVGLSGAIIMNPPYGERIEVRGKAAAVRAVSGSEQRDADDDFFPRLAAHWKRAFTEQPWTAWMLCPDMKLPSKMRLKESRRVPMWNGPIECRLFRFDLVKGSAR